MPTPVEDRPKFFVVIYENPEPGWLEDRIHVMLFDRHGYRHGRIVGEPIKSWSYDSRFWARRKAAKVLRQAYAGKNFRPKDRIEVLT